MISLRRFVTHNMFLKIFSLILATLVWIYVSFVYGAKVTNSSVFQIQIQNAPTKYQISLEQEEVEITIEAPSNTIDTHRKNISAYLDFSEIQSGSYKMKPIVDAPEEVSVLIVDPPFIEVTVEEIITNDFSVRVILTGNLQAGNIAGEPTVSPEIVHISGIESSIHSIHSVFVEVDLSNASSDILSHAKVEARDSLNQPIPGLTIEPESVQVSVPVLNTDISKVLPVIPTISGNPLGTVTSILVEPNILTVSGDISILEPLQSLNTQPIVIDGVNQTVSREVDILLPQGVHVVQENQSVLVTITIEPTASTVFENIQIKILNLPFDIDYSLEFPTIQIKLYGLASKLPQIEDIEAFIDVQGLEMGTHLVPVQLRNIPQGIIAQSIPDKITIELFPIESESESQSLPPLLSIRKCRVLVTPSPI
jgi:YbbR domain-containing protein